MALRDGPNLDAFGRLRISSPDSIFGASQEYNFHPLLWDHFTASGGTATHATLTNSSVLATASEASGARALRQLKVYLRYSPGKSQLLKLTGTLRKSGTPVGAAYGGIGYYDDGNGLYFRSDATGVAVVQRSDTSGSAVEERVYQPQWNLDKMNGTGPSGITIDWSKEQIFAIDMQWLGVGRVRFGLNVGGVLYYVHEFDNSNSKTAVYMRTACLPVRYEAFNGGGAGSNIAVEAVCSSGESEGGMHADDYYSFCYSAYLTPASVDTTMRPLIQRRLRDTFNGLTVRGHAHLNGFDLSVTSNTIYWEIRYNATVVIGGGGSTVGPTLVDATNSISEFDTYTGTANTVTGGVLVSNGFAAPGSGSRSSTIAVHNTGARPLLGRSYGGTRDSYTLSARAMTNTAGESVAVQLQEQY
jgi:hypothetical protein